MLFNYMPLEYFKSLLDKGLYFRKASEFKDKSEGDFPKRAVQDCMQGLKYKIPDSSLISDLDNLMHGILESNKITTFINCWHRNTEFSKQMWDEYAQGEEGGLYIKTRPDLIYLSLSDTARQLFEITKYLLLEEVIYSNNPETEISEMVLADCIIKAKSHKIKKRKFDFENEFRIVINQTRFSCYTGKSFNSLQIDELVKDCMRIPPEEFQLDESTEENEVTGIFIKINPSILIDVIGTVGDNNIGKIQSIMKDYSLNIQVIDESRKFT